MFASNIGVLVEVKAECSVISGNNSAKSSITLITILYLDRKAKEPQDQKFCPFQENYFQ